MFWTGVGNQSEQVLLNTSNAHCGSNSHTIRHQLWPWHQVCRVGWVGGWVYKAGKAWSLPISLANIASCGCKRCHGQILAAVSREGMSHSRTLIVMFHICICRVVCTTQIFQVSAKKLTQPPFLQTHFLQKLLDIFSSNHDRNVYNHQTDHNHNCDIFS